MKILNNKGPKIGPSGKPLTISVEYIKNVGLEFH